MAARPDLRTSVMRVSRLHFVYAVLFIVQIMIYDAWKLIEPAVVLRRWVMAGILLIVTAVVWFLAHGKAGNLALYKRLTFALILADIFVASFSVYIQRGMAARAVMLFTVPIIISTILKSRSAIFMTTVISIVAYTSTAVAYFVLNFNEGYKIELYGEITFYAVLMLILASFLWVTTKPHKN